MVKFKSDVPRRTAVQAHLNYLPLWRKTAHLMHDTHLKVSPVRERVRSAVRTLTW